jgi:hypothetical protein
VRIRWRPRCRGEMDGDAANVEMQRGVLEGVGNTSTVNRASSRCMSSVFIQRAWCCQKQEQSHEASPILCEGDGADSRLPSAHDGSPARSPRRCEDGRPLFPHANQGAVHHENQPRSSTARCWVLSLQAERSRDAKVRAGALPLRKGSCSC